MNLAAARADKRSSARCRQTSAERAWGAAGTPAWATVDAGTVEVLQVPHADQVWTPTVFTDVTGAVTHEVSAASWGSARTVTVVDPTAPSPTLGFSSTIDAASAAGLVHMRARDYDPATGQFLTPDPWQRPDGQPWVGVHAYTDGDPVSFWDPSGLRRADATGGRGDRYPNGSCKPSRSGGWTPCHVGDALSSAWNWITGNADKVLGAAVGCAAGAVAGARTGAFAGLGLGTAVAAFSAGTSIPAFVTGGTVTGAVGGCAAGGAYSVIEESPPGAPGAFG